MKRRPPIALDALDHLLLMALRYALPRTISTGEPDREVIAAWTSQLPWLPSWALSQALEECAHVDRGDAACAGALCDSPTMRAAASERRGRFRAAVAGELARRAGSGVIHPESHHPAGTEPKSYHPRYSPRGAT